MFELIALLMECQEKGHLPVELDSRVRLVLNEMLAQCDATASYILQGDE